MLRQELKENLLSQHEGMLDRVQQVKEGLGSKIRRLGQMVNFSIAEAHSRTANLMEECENVKINSTYLSEQILLVKERVRSIELKMGIYTGEDKYYM